MLGLESSHLAERDLLMAILGIVMLISLSAYVVLWLLVPKEAVMMTMMLLNIALGTAPLFLLVSLMFSLMFDFPVIYFEDHSEDTDAFLGGYFVPLHLFAMCLGICTGIVIRAEIRKKSRVPSERQDSDS